jgi:hypothetical protein
MPAFTPNPNFVAGISRGTTNRTLFDQGRLSEIDWFRFEWNRPAMNQVTIVAYDIAAEPAPAPATMALPADLEQAFQALGQPVPPQIAAKFAPPRPQPVLFSNDELLAILAQVRDFQKPNDFLGREVFITGRLILSVAMQLVAPLRKAREISIYSPADLKDVCFWRRNPHKLDELVPGDLISWTRDRNGGGWEVLNVGTSQVNLKESGGSRDSSTLWLKRPQEVGGWA